jgi:ribosomal protein S18 acetylase RimI-like enzyme
MVRNAPIVEHLNVEIKLRPAQAEDALPVAACVNTAYQHYVDRIGKAPAPMLDDYARIISERQVSIAERNGAIVGILVLNATDNGFFVDNVAVEPSHQGLGIGRILLELAESEARRQGFASINLYTHEKMVENQSLYGRIGYVEYARRVEHGYSRVYMRKMLT